ncbi:5746_t:CDS:2 [Diversispora eburnea]|uniref:5746_t:CDS:1 n=1 Tax=Diversispora eburnea TaxID=1213867 RepID=A0A9N8YJ34_9GLOM|nr:5746_t:CDS:2 [Diversispora eburnea]
MPVCRYFLEGRCRFGNLCRDEHVGNGNQRYNQQRNDNNNIYDQGGSGTHNNNNNNNNSKPYDERSVRTDLTKDRPIYRYSVYGPVKDEPNLIEETDYSPEELRLQYYIIMGTYGNDASYQNGVKDLENRMQMKVDSTLKDLRSALNTFESKKQQTSSFGSFATPSAYGSNVPSAFGSNTPNTFGSNTPSAFNNNPSSTYNINPSNSFGSNIPNAYGSNTPSAFNNNPPNAFNNNPPSAFGSNQPSAFGSNSIGFPQPQPPLQFGASTFGNNSLESNQNAFGSTTPAAFGGEGGGGEEAPPFIFKK